MTDLLELRDQIDKIDREIVRLFEERMDVCRQVAEYKIANGKKVLDRGRELEKLDTLGALTHNDFNRPWHTGAVPADHVHKQETAVSASGAGRGIRKPSVYADRPD